MSLPAVAAQCVNVLYNVVDRIYIGNIPDIGATALTGVGVTFPILMIISAFSAFVGMGGAPLASIKMGQGIVIFIAVEFHAMRYFTHFTVHPYIQVSFFTYLFEKFPVMSLT